MIIITIIVIVIILLIITQITENINSAYNITETIKSALQYNI